MRFGFGVDAMLVKLPVKPEKVTERPTDFGKTVVFEGVDLPQFDHVEHRSIVCENLEKAVDLGEKLAKCDPKCAVAWCSRRKRCWIKIDARKKHRPRKFENNEWKSKATFAARETSTMIYYYRNDLCFF